MLIDAISLFVSLVLYAILIALLHVAVGLETNFLSLTAGAFTVICIHYTLKVVQNSKDG